MPPKMPLWPAGKFFGLQSQQMIASRNALAMMPVTSKVVSAPTQ
jgi:hypothetical protein